MIEILPLLTFDSEAFEQLELGYTSSEKYQAAKVETPERTLISLDLVQLEQPYVKRWKLLPEDIQHYEAAAQEGLSLGAFEGGRLVGIALTEARRWNGTLWVWEVGVAAAHQRKGIGRQLLDRLAANALQAGFRVLTLETQNTNVPAIRFYRSLGFEIDAIDLSLYTNEDITDFEVAIFMKRKLR